MRTLYWECDAGCGYTTIEPPALGTFVRYASDTDTNGTPLVPMMEVAFINPTGAPDSPIHICERCFGMGMTTLTGKDVSNGEA